MTSAAPELIFIHPSDELYGADRMLLEMLDATTDGRRVQVWLPTDLAHGRRPLCAVLADRNVAVRHVDLPILRRSYRTVTGMGRLAGRWSRLVAELRRVGPAAVYCTTSAATLAAPAARLAGVGTVIGHVQEIWSGSDRVMLTPGASACHRLVAISEASRRSLGDRLSRRTTVVPNGVQDPGTGIDLGERSGPLKFVVASRWNGWKGHETLLSAWDRVPDPGHLVVLGGPPPIGDAIDVPELVSRLRRPDSVSVVGEVPDVAGHLDAADVALVPSDQPEPFGLVAIEAFARGRPVIASAGGGLTDIVTHGHDGWLYPPGDHRALAALLAGLDRDQVTAAGRQARKTYQSRFTTSLFAASWLAATGLDQVG